MIQNSPGASTNTSISCNLHQKQHLLTFLDTGPGVPDVTKNGKGIVFGATKNSNKLEKNKSHIPTDLRLCNKNTVKSPKSSSGFLKRTVQRSVFFSSWTWGVPSQSHIVMITIMTRGKDWKTYITAYEPLFRHHFKFPYIIHCSMSESLVLKDIVYHPEVYNALPSLEWAKQKFNERNGINLIQGKLKDLAR